MSEPLSTLGLTVRCWACDAAPGERCKTDHWTRMHWVRITFALGLDQDAGDEDDGYLRSAS